MLKEAMRTGVLEGIKIADSAPKVNHLLFADDCILFCKADVAEATKLKGVLDKYCDASGQCVSQEKSSVYFGKGCADNYRQEIKHALQLHKETLNDKYLGLPTDVGRSKNGAFGYIKERIWKRVQGWMEKFLSGGGKEILIKSVLQAIPTYSMALFKLPRGLCDHIT
jgi:hypothetical protein